MQTLPIFAPAPAPGHMGFSIGGWHPFSGGAVTTLTGGTVNGQTVASGGLAGLAAHLDQIAHGVNASLIGGTVGKKLDDLIFLMDKPWQDTADAIDQNLSIILGLVAIVGFFFGGEIIAAYADAAWVADVGEEAVSSVSMSTDFLDMAPTALDTSVDLAPATLDLAPVGVETVSPMTALNTISAPDLGPELPALAQAPVDLSPAVDPAAVLAQPVAAPLSATTYTTAAAGGGSALDAGLNSVAKAAGSKLGSAAAGALLTAAGLGTVPAGVALPSSPVATLTANLPTWWPWAALGGLLLVLR